MTFLLGHSIVIQCPINHKIFGQARPRLIGRAGAVAGNASILRTKTHLYRIEAGGAAAK
jgi:hypothetical protein